MRKRQIVLFIFLLLFWLLLSSDYDAQHIITGLVLAGLVTWFWGDLSDLLPSRSLVGTLPATIRFALTLLWEIVLANLTVGKAVLSSRSKLDSGFVSFKPDLQTSWGRILLANTITITPGTVTIDVNPNTGYFMVHGLTKDLREGLEDSRMVRVIQRLEGSRVK
ncbi:MAG: Na+/H+ antiporter subunit E [Limnochordia bacterium]|nr:Na+/H+ antiporter subunit E [Limnochordia bacterium]